MYRYRHLDSHDSLMNPNIMMYVQQQELVFCVEIGE